MCCVCGSTEDDDGATSCSIDSRFWLRFFGCDIADPPPDVECYRAHEVLSWLSFSVPFNIAASLVNVLSVASLGVSTYKYFTRGDVAWGWFGAALLMVQCCLYVIITPVIFSRNHDLQSGL